MVEAVEGGRGVRAASSPHESRAVTGAETVQATGQPSGASTLATRKSPARWALALLLVPIAVGTWYFARPSAAPSASAPIAASTPITTTTGTSPPSVVASIEPAPSSPPVATTATTTKTALTPHSTQRPPRATVAPPPPDCNPPYVLDAKGIRVPKKECL